MKKLMLLFSIIVASPALAHPSIVPHDHPHGLSGLMGLDLILLVALGAIVAWIVAEKSKGA